MRQRLGLADVLIKNPEIIILDEPTSGIDPAGVQEFIELIRWLSKEKGLTVLFFLSSPGSGTKSMRPGRII